MRVRMLSFCLLTWLLPMACSDPSWLKINIDGTAAVPPLTSPATVDNLLISLQADGTQILGESFVLEGVERPLLESLVIRPTGDARLSLLIQVSARHDELILAEGTARAMLVTGKGSEATVVVDWLPGACLDSDGDGYGHGPGCAGEDCADDQGGIHPGRGEECNQVDDDCDELVDESADLDPPRCAKVSGVCQQARQRCVDGEYLPCVIADYGPDYQDAETACDGKDNDCDGAVDENCPCEIGSTRSCNGPDSGLCQPGRQECQDVAGQGRWSETCEGAVLPVAEVCNEQDDDCDGQTDEDFDLATDPANCGQCGLPCLANHGTGACRSSVCVVSACETGYYDINLDFDDGCEYECTPSVPPDEVCDQVDNDCDEDTDEDFDLTSDPANCGQCGHTCPQTHGQVSCRASACTVEACDDGHWDNNHDGDDGCEYPCTPTEPATEVCDGQDNDCDGATDGPTSDCSDSDPCTRDLCLAGECANPILDADEDGFGADYCGGDDCDDGDADIYPGQAELCDDVDQDCDGLARDVAGTVSVHQEFTIEECHPGVFPGQTAIAVAANGHIGIAYICMDSDVTYLDYLAVAVLNRQGDLLFSDVAFIGSDRNEARIAALGTDRFIAASVAGSSHATFPGQTVFVSFDASGLLSENALPATPETGVPDLAKSIWNSDHVVALYPSFENAPASYEFVILDDQLQFVGSPVATGLTTACEANYQTVGHVSVSLVPASVGILAFGCCDDTDALRAVWIQGESSAGTPHTLHDTCAGRQFRGTITHPPGGDELHLLAIGTYYDDYQDAFFRVNAQSNQAVNVVLQGPFTGPHDYVLYPLPVDGNGILGVACTGNDAKRVVAEGDMSTFVSLGGLTSTYSNTCAAVSLGGGGMAVSLNTAYKEEILVVIEDTCAVAY